MMDDEKGRTAAGRTIACLDTARAERRKKSDIFAAVNGVV